MASYYVYHAAAGTADGSSWTNAYVTLQAAMSARSAGDIFYVAHDHAQTVAASTVTIASPGTEASPCRVYCVDRAGSVPPVSADLRTTASITVTGNGGITQNGSIAECYGIIFQAGSGGVNVTLNVNVSSNRCSRFVNCTFRMPATGSTGRIALGTVGGMTVFENCTVRFANASQGMLPIGRLIWRNTSPAIEAGGTTPTTLFLIGNGLTETFLEGLDLSAITNTLVLNTGTGPSRVLIKNCKIAASTINATPVQMGGLEVTVLRSDSGDTNYRTERRTYSGTQTTETTIVRSGGASDGTTPIATKIVTTANCSRLAVYECLPITIWNETLATTMTVTVEGIWGGGSTPTNADIWIECYYPGIAGTCQAFGTTSGPTSSGGTMVMLEPATNYPAGSGTWGGSTTQFAMSVTVYAEEKGPITIYVKAGVASSTFYIDPKPVVT